MLLSQPSVSLQIKALEPRLGVQLFERHGPRIALTYDGQRLLELAGPLVEAIDGLEASFCSVRESVEHGIVNVAAGGSSPSSTSCRVLWQSLAGYFHGLMSAYII